jgi:hypothetical protein
VWPILSANASGGPEKKKKPNLVTLIVTDFLNRISFRCACLRALTLVHLFSIFASQRFFSPVELGCQMVTFQTKNPNLGKFWRAIDGKMLTYFMATWNILQTFGIFCDHLVHFVFIWYIFSGFGIMYQEKSGNPAVEPTNQSSFEPNVSKPFFFNSFANKKHLSENVSGSSHPLI